MFKNIFAAAVFLVAPFAFSRADVITICHGDFCEQIRVSVSARTELPPVVRFSHPVPVVYDPMPRGPEPAVVRVASPACVSCQASAEAAPVVVYEQRPIFPLFQRRWLPFRRLLFLPILRRFF